MNEANKLMTMVLASFRKFLVRVVHLWAFIMLHIAAVFMVLGLMFGPKSREAYRAAREEIWRGFEEGEW